MEGFLWLVVIVLALVLLRAESAAKRILEEARLAKDENSRLYSENSRLSTENSRLSGTVNHYQQSEQQLGLYAVRMSAAHQELERIQAVLVAADALADEKETIVYPRRFPEDTSEQLKAKLKQLKERQASIRKKGQVVIQFGEGLQERLNRDELKKLKALVKLARLALEGAADTLLDQVKAANLAKVDAKFKAVVADLNRTLQPWGFEIGKNYQATVEDSLELMSEHQQQLEKEREEQRALREQMREEAAAQREAERAEKEADSEARRAERDLLKAREAAEKATVEERSRWLDKVQQLEMALAEAQRAKERAKSMAQLTRTGHVYVISNIGSFGTNVYKVGMTRRLDPYDRIVELGDASVPFPFDIHGMIHSDDAPRLEREMHSRLERHRMNLVNERKEFFDVPFDEIKTIVSELGFKVELTALAEAVQYRQSDAMRKGLVFESPAFVDERGAESPDEVE